MWDDLLLEAYLTRIVQRLAPHVRPRSFVYRIRVVRDPTLNAFTFGGGFVYVHVGLLARMESEAQLASVIAHEMAHSTERHIPRRIEAEYNTKLLGSILRGVAGGTGVLQGPALNSLYRLVMSAAINGQGRGREVEADVVCMDYLYKAGYDPRETPGAFQQMLKLYGDSSPEETFFYGSHPTNVSRHKRAQELIKTKYAKLLEGRKLTVNSEEYKRRTRKAVVICGVLDFDTKRFGTSEAMLKKALNVREENPLCHYYLGKIALETGSDTRAVDRSITRFNKAIEYDSKYAPAYRDVGLAYYRKGNNKLAIKNLEEYLKLEPEAKDAKQVRTAIEDLKQE